MTVREDFNRAVGYQPSYTSKQANDVNIPKMQVMADEYIPSYKELPTKGYIDNVIKDATNKISQGENVSQNQRILDIFSNIAKY